MAPQASPAMAMPQVTQPEPFPIGLRLAPAPAATAELADHHLRPLEVAECSMCGIARPLGLLVPDGGGACADVRWYCKDVKSCTERWTEAQTATPLLPQPQADRSLLPRSAAALL
jgi:hypothetical protein